MAHPVWRIAGFVLLFIILGAAGGLAISVLPRSPLAWGGLAVSTGAALLAGWILLTRVDARPPGALGFPLHRRALGESVTGLGLGVLLITATTLLLLLTGSASFAVVAGSPKAYVGFVGWTFGYFALAAAFEEVLFRGYPFQVLVAWVGVWPAVALGSIVFAGVHIQNPNVTSLALVNLFLAGVLLSVAYLKTLSLWFATGVHLGWNWMMASVFDFPVSGLGFDTPLYDGVTHGPVLWTGGAFGPEAGLAATFVLVGGTIWLMRTGRVGVAAETLSRQPLAISRIGGLARR